MAKYLVDSRARVDPSWYALADEIVKTTTPEAWFDGPRRETDVWLRGRESCRGLLVNEANSGR